MRHPIFIVVILFAGFGIVGAQNGVGLRYYINTGMTLPSSPEVFSRYWSAGPDFGIGLGYQVTDCIVLRGYMDYQRMTHSADKERADMSNGDEVDFQGGAATILSGMADFKISMRPAAASFIPYLVFGAGYLRLSLADLTTTYQGEAYTNSVDPESATVLSMGAGCDFRLADRVTLFVEGKYAIGYTDGDNTLYVPLKIGIAFR